MQRHIRKDKQLAAKARKAAKSASYAKRPSAVKSAPAKTNHAQDLRGALAWLKSQGDLIETKKESIPTSKSPACRSTWTAAAR
jgi:hypothetical protein